MSTRYTKNHLLKSPNSSSFTTKSEENSLPVNKTILIVEMIFSATQLPARRHFEYLPSIRCSPCPFFFHTKEPTLFSAASLFLHQTLTTTPDNGGRETWQKDANFSQYWKENDAPIGGYSYVQSCFSSISWKRNWNSKLFSNKLPFSEF